MATLPGKRPIHVDWDKDIERVSLILEAVLTLRFGQPRDQSTTHMANELARAALRELRGPA